MIDALGFAPFQTSPDHCEAYRRRASIVVAPENGLTFTRPAQSTFWRTSASSCQIHSGRLTLLSRPGSRRGWHGGSVRRPRGFVGQGTRLRHGAPTNWWQSIFQSPDARPANTRGPIVLPRCGRVRARGMRRGGSNAGFAVDRFISAPVHHLDAALVPDPLWRDAVKGSELFERYLLGRPCGWLPPRLIWSLASLPVRRRRRMQTAFELIVPEASAPAFGIQKGDLRHDLSHQQPIQARCDDGCRSAIQPGPSWLAQKVLKFGNRGGQECDRASAEYTASRYSGIHARRRGAALRWPILPVPSHRGAPNPSQVSTQFGTDSRFLYRIRC